MKNIKNIFYAGMLAFCTISFTACDDKEDTYDFPGDSYNRVYMLDQSGSYKIVQTPISTVSNLNFEASLKCTQKASSSIKATVEVDNSMIAAYNEKHGTKYEAIPANALVIENATVNIPANAMASSDTLRISITKDESILTTLRSENGYLIPLRLAKAEGGDSQPSSNFFTSYLVVTVTEDNINHDAVVGDITGTLVADQTGWSATTNATVYSYYQPLTYLFTTATSSYCYLYNVPTINLDIDMGKSYTFDAIKLQRSTATASFASGMSIFSSNDGTTWKSEGTLTKSTTFCAFYAPITTRYVRIVKSSGSTSNTTLYASIFNIYAK
ncbi:MAG: BT_3987 domain-containing protein [Dysgonomonas sp.]